MHGVDSNNNNEKSEDELLDEIDDDPILQGWREQRLEELKKQYQTLFHNLIFLGCSFLRS